jgi:hypothetical protein
MTKLSLGTLACALFVSAPMAVDDVLLPGSRDLATAHFHDGSIQYSTVRSASADSAERELGLTRETTALTSYNGSPAILSVGSSVFNGKTYTDSAMVLRAGLTPVWEHYRFGTAGSRIVYDGARVQRTFTEGDSVLRHVDHTYNVRVFDFQELDEIIRSVPLRTGYHAILPLYSEGDDALEMDTVQVEGRDSAGVWAVRFADKVIIEHYGIDGRTRDLTRLEVERHAGGPHFRRVFH